MRKSLAGLVMVVMVLAGCRKVSDPPVPDKGVDFEACVQGAGASAFEIVTFNVETFPKGGYESVQVLADLVSEMDADLVAFQEVASEADFIKLDELLPAYRGIFYPIDNDDWNLAYLYKTGSVTVDQEETKILFQGDFSAFPRPPFEIHVTHQATGLSVVVINNHLKCCGGTDNEERRRSASDQLHNYVETTYPDVPVVILGDLNDEITGETEQSNVFWSFVNDPGDFAFADMAIATGSPIWWSYPSWPSHIDHIIISDELFSRKDTVMVFKPDACYSDYPDILSDHRPVFLRLK